MFSIALYKFPMFILLLHSLSYLKHSKLLHWWLTMCKIRVK